MGDAFVRQELQKKIHNNFVLQIQIFTNPATTAESDEILQTTPTEFKNITQNAIRATSAINVQVASKHPIRSPHVSA